MSYETALEAAGCEILEFQMTGSYQGEWYALVKVDSNVGVVRGSYGSCSACDAFESEFGYSEDEYRGDYQVRLKDFGLGYLPALPIDLEIVNLEKSIGDYDWGDEREALGFMKSWKIKYNI